MDREDGCLLQNGAAEEHRRDLNVHTYATGSNSGRNAYFRTGNFLRHQTDANITATIQDNGNLVWSHGNTSSVSAAGPKASPQVIPTPMKEQPQVIQTMDIETAPTKKSAGGPDAAAAEWETEMKLFGNPGTSGNFIGSSL